ncbi:DUF2339 domain-containing protein [Candidatus Uabimicrobium sp. HlEnr_7]|uniref:DUF2339 domain-containing protein n=1 Tax=Candidatus Uabimicrobium helgolandensis TaxID=3095367 RepID=UPI00355607B4
MRFAFWLWLILIFTAMFGIMLIGGFLYMFDKGGVTQGLAIILFSAAPYVWLTRAAEKFKQLLVEASNSKIMLLQKKVNHLENICKKNNVDVEELFVANQEIKGYLENLQLDTTVKSMPAAEFDTVQNLNVDCKDQYIEEDAEKQEFVKLQSLQKETQAYPKEQQAKLISAQNSFNDKEIAQETISKKVTSDQPLDFAKSNDDKALYQKVVGKFVKPIKKAKSIEARFFSGNFENFVGEKLLSYLGIGIFVLGLAFLLAYSLTQMGAVGRILTGVFCSLTLLGLGSFLEKISKYDLYGKILMAGGWAVLYFVSYGSYHIEAMKILSSPITGALFIAVVASCIIKHSLRYRSESLTGVSLLMGYATLFITEVTIYTHFAALALAISICFFVWRFRWLTTALIGSVMLYTGYGSWLYSQAPKSLPSGKIEYTIATAILIAIWLCFKLPDFATNKEKSESKLVILMGVLNLFGLALTRKILHITFGTKGSPASALYLGAIYLVLAELIRKRGKQNIYKLDFTVATGLILVGTWSSFSQYAYCMFSWMAIGIVIFSYAFYRRLKYFRNLGNVILAMATILILGGAYPKQMIVWFHSLFSGELFLNVPSSLPTGQTVTSFSSGVVGIIGSILIFITAFISSYILQNRKLWDNVSEARQQVVLHILGTVSMTIGLYKIFSGNTCIYSWMVFAVFLFYYGIFNRKFHLRYLSHLLLLLAVCSGKLLDLSNEHIGYAVIIGAMLFYIHGYITYKLFKEDSLGDNEYIEKFITVIATIAMMVGAILLFSNFVTTLAWLGLASLLFFYGIFRRDFFIRLVSNIVIVLVSHYTLIPILVEANIDTVTLWGNWKANPLVIALTLTTLLLYLHVYYLSKILSKKERGNIEEERYMVIFANLVLFVNLWYTLPAITVAIAYSLAAIIFFECGVKWQKNYLKTYSSIAVILSGFWFFTVNMGANDFIHGMSRRLLTSLPILLMWAYCANGWRNNSQKSDVSKEEKPLIASDKLLALNKLAPSWLSYLIFSAIVMLVYHHAFMDGLGWLVLGAILTVMTTVFKHSRYSLQSFIVVVMGTLSFCAVATRNVGDSFSYIMQHPTIAIGPLLLFAIHFYSKIKPDFFERESDKVAIGPGTRFVHHSSSNHAIIFCTVVTFVVVTMLSSSYYSFAWGMAAFFLGWYGLSFREKIFRWAALSLFGLAVAKIALLDIFYFSIELRIVTLIGVGIALLLISFMYNRLKDKVTQFLNG